MRKGGQLPCKGGSVAVQMGDRRRAKRGTITVRGGRSRSYARLAPAVLLRAPYALLNTSFCPVIPPTGPEGESMVLPLNQCLALRYAFLHTLVEASFDLFRPAAPLRLLPRQGSAISSVWRDRRGTCVAKKGGDTQ